MLSHGKGRKINVFSPLILRELLFVLLPRPSSGGQEVEALIKIGGRATIAGRGEKKKKHVGGPLCGHMAAAELAMLRRRGVSLRVSVRGLFFFSAESIHSVH